MFSGIVEELGQVAENAIETRGRLRVGAREVVRDVTVGDSIAVNGCCLTVVAADTHGFTADVMPETARRTNLGILEAGDPVNLEAALAYGDRVGGHMVTGHVDAVGTVCESREEANARWVDDRFTVSLIPHTVAVTTARRWQVDRLVNLEVDLIARYVERSLAALGTVRSA
jgi:riboflavin synthase